MTLNAPQNNDTTPQRGETLLVATHNAGKAKEIQSLLQDLGLNIVTLSDTDLPAPEETGTTFHANASLKANAAGSATGYWTLADDSGLEVLTLDGAPGVDTAHYGGWKHLLDVMRDTALERRQARFLCILALRSPQGVITYFEGICEGQISLEARGTGGFGYDPVFIPTGDDRTFAEMTPHEKHHYSHRGQALRHFVAWLNKATA